jgi:hypothetical protein
MFCIAETNDSSARCPSCRLIPYEGRTAEIKSISVVVICVGQYLLDVCILRPNRGRLKKDGQEI